MAACLSMGYGFIFTMLGELRDEFDFSDSGVGAIAASGFLAGFVAQATLSRYADRGHGHRLLRFGMACAVAGSLWMLTATEVWQFVGSRLLVGLGTGAASPVLRRVVILRDPERVGHNMGVLTSAEMAGFVVGPALAGVLVEGWIRLPFVILAASYASMSLLALRVESPPARADSSRSVNRKLLATPTFQGSLACGAGFFAVIGLWEATWSLLLGDLGAGTTFIGVTLSLFTIPMIFLAPIGGRVAQRMGPLQLSTRTTLIAAAAMVAYGAAGEMRLDPVPENPPVHIAALTMLMILALVHSIADTFTMTGNQVAVARSTAEGDVAAAQGLFSACGLLVSFLVAGGGTVVYDAAGPMVAFCSVAAVMVACVAIARWRAPELLRPVAPEPDDSVAPAGAVA